MADTDQTGRAFLLVVALGLAPVALSYGLAPGRTMPWLLGIDASGINTRHVFRALMGLYLGFVCFWIAGALRADLRRPALLSFVVFMAGVGLGRLYIILIDGWPHVLMLAYTAIEAGLAVIGILLLRSPSTE